MSALGVFIFTLILLFFSSQLLTKALSRLLYKFTSSQKIVITLLALLFLPGVIIHELSHLLMANVLFVKTGEIEFLPKIQGDSVKLGSVQVAQTDPFRRALIGLSPMIVGIPLLFFALSYIVSVPFSLEKGVLLRYFICGYTIFELGNTLFSSKKDLEGTVELGLAIGFVLGVGYFAGLRQPFDLLQAILSPQITQLLLSVSILLIIPIGINGGIYLFSKLVTK